MTLTAALLSTLLAAGQTPFWVEGPRGKVRVDLRGSGSRTLVFLHGNGGRLEQWEGQLKAFGEKHRVLALDLPGMGDSEAPKQGDYAVAALAADLHAVLDSLKVRKAVLVAHSYGGAVAMALAGRWPSQFDGVFLVDVAGDVREATPEGRARIKARLDPLDCDQDRYFKVLDRVFTPILAEAQASTRELVFAQARATSREAFLGALAGLQDFDPAASLATFPGPVWNLFTERLGSAGRIDQQALRVQGTPLRGVSHWPMLDQPKAFNVRLQAFLDAVRPELRQFDFWVGDWEVRDAKGTFLGTNRVQPTLGGMALMENWEGSQGGVGKSFNAWQPATGRWRQTWLDHQGSFLDVQGGLEGASMVMSGSTPGPKGATHQRITWTPLADGRVRQLWESSQDGRTWTPAFDGYYQRKN